MKFFTRAWADGDLPDVDDKATGPDYWNYLNNLNLPAQLHELAKLNSHDACILALFHDDADGSLALRLRCGDLRVGYYDACLKFSGVAIHPDHLELLRRSLRPADVEMLYDEVDRTSPDQFEYRFLLQPAGEVAIRFRTVTLTRQPVPDRQSP